MTFETVALRGGGVGVAAHGVIERGDATRLREALEVSRPRADGWTPFLLDSNGGNLSEAFRMAEVIRDRALMPVVPPGAVCDSACASVLLLAGPRSLVTQGATLFFHACRSRGGDVDRARECNRLVSDEMREQHDFIDALLLTTLDGFVEDEDEMSREDRKIEAPVVDCLAIDLPPWAEARPSPTRCGRGDLKARDPMAARVDVDPGTSPSPEPVPGSVHPVWFLFHWTPPDQWAFWRVADGVALGFRPRGSFRNGPELRIYCHLAGKGSAGETMVELRLPASRAAAQARSVAIEGRRRHVGRVLSSERVADGPFATDGTWETQIVRAQFEAAIWPDLAGGGGEISVMLLASNGAPLLRRGYGTAGFGPRAQAARENCVGAFEPAD